MARDYGKILFTLFSDRDFRALTPNAQRVYTILLGEKQTNNAGLMPLMKSKWRKGSDYSTDEDIDGGLRELESNRYVFVDDDTEELLIRSFMRNDGVERIPNVMKNAMKVCRNVESPKLASILVREIERLDESKRSDVETMKLAALEHLRTIAEPYRNPSETLVDPPKGSGTLSKPCVVDEVEVVSTVPEYSSSKDSPATPSRTSELFAEFWSAYPRKVGKGAAEKAFTRAVKRAGDTVVLDGVRRLAADPNLPTEKKFIPHPRTWLNEDRWEDEPLPPDRATPRYSRPDPTARQTSVTEIANRLRSQQGATR
ncbi:hypothetical protein [Rhodococcus sp. MEB064]|uniref:hypothetical protein n=1 Tax=Rhodococcus sp. MEB064 TaxID=1587522 RepID=UPI000695C38C|nr:hypothetical protein [Rhodococcus sp. MEB064]